MDEIDLRILAVLQESFPIVERPFLKLAESLGIGEDELIRRVVRLKELGLIRRIGPILDLRRLGMSGVLVAMKVSPEDADVVSSVVNEYDEVSHNYLRPNDSGYNLWFTISAPAERVDEIISEIKRRTGREMLVLPTIKIFKIGVKFDII
ncbi:MAG: AsnC family transcriptional regulator [Methanothrix sp.]|nr:AsnC family transcriptional regulator [Methanothrix sp.]MCX8206985.1 AsnC family transcriptional regulator [Methanothrix sp.]